MKDVSGGKMAPNCTNNEASPSALAKHQRLCHSSEPGKHSAITVHKGLEKNTMQSQCPKVKIKLALQSLVQQIPGTVYKVFSEDMKIWIAAV